MIDLKPFCSVDETRTESIGCPFTLDDKTYATDGRILLEVEKRQDVPVNPKSPEASLRRALAAWRDGGVWESLPTIPPAQYDECESCGSTDRLLVSCIMDIRQKTFNAEYLRLVATLPNVLINPQGEWDEPMSFKFDGGRGLLMPMNITADGKVRQ